VLGVRPIYLRTEAHINAHFLACFLALLIGRVIEKRLGHKYTIEQITETLRNISASNVSENIWVFDYVDDAAIDMNAAFGTNFGLKAMTLQDIKKNLASVKKR
jgi:hypothetical protein